MRAARWLVVILLALTAARVAVVVLAEPSPDEAYQFLCGARPAAAYFDGPGGAAFVAGLSARWGVPPVAWRLTAPLWALVASVLAFLLVRAVMNPLAALLATLLLNVLPVFNAWSVRAGPMLPALALALLGLVFVWRARRPHARVVLGLLGAGVCFGGAGLFWYPAVVLALFAAISLLARREGGLSALAGVVLMLAVAGFMLAPALAWNAANDWIPIAGGTFRTLWEFDVAGFGRQSVRLVWQFSPLILLGLAAGWGMCLRGVRVQRSARFVFLLTLPMVGGAVYWLLRGQDAAAYILLAAPLLLGYARELVSRPGGGILAVAAVGLALAGSVTHVAEAFRAGEGWHQTADSVRQIFLEESAHEGEEGLFLIAEDAELAAVLGYYLRNDLIPPAGHPTVYVPESQAVTNQFGLWPGYGDFLAVGKTGDADEAGGENPFIGRSALYITRESEANLPQSIAGAFEAVGEIGTIPQPGKDALHIFVCVNYQTMPL